MKQVMGEKPVGVQPEGRRSRQWVGHLLVFSLRGEGRGSR